MQLAPGTTFNWSCPRCYALAHTTLRLDYSGKAWAWFVCPTDRCAVWMPETLEIYAQKSRCVLKEVPPGEEPWGLPGNYPEFSMQQLAKMREAEEPDKPSQTTFEDILKE